VPQQIHSPSFLEDHHREKPTYQKEQ